MRQEPQLSVTVAKVTGDHLAFIVDGQTSAAELKRMIAKCWSLSPVCQQLVSTRSSEPLRDTDMLSDHVCGGSATAVELSLVVSQNQVDAIGALVEISHQ